MIIPDTLSQVAIRPIQVALASLAVYVVYGFVQRARARSRVTPLGGPPSPSWLFGAGRILLDAPNAGEKFEEWADQYGLMFRVGAPLGGTRLLVCDPKAIMHFYANETYTYVNNKLARVAIEQLFGRGLLWAEGDSHKRQRKAISPAFSNVAIRRLTAVFYDSAYKLKTHWDKKLETSDFAMINVQSWMNHVSLDSIGIAGFSHDFGSLDGKYSAVAQVFDSMGTIKPGPLTAIVIMLGHIFPILYKIPIETRRLERRLTQSMGEIATELLANTRREKKLGGKAESAAEKSLIGVLLRAEDSDTSLSMSQEEIMAQMKVLILAGYETTSISLTWALIELCRKPEKQARLRREILEEFPAADPTWDELTNGTNLVYLDAVVHEVLRLHPPLSNTTRVAAVDDVLPLSRPLRLPDGTFTDTVAVAKGDSITVPIGFINKSTEFWGPDAKEFVPERWIAAEGGGVPKRAQEIQGHRHILTFVDGPRICLGRGFALAEFKAVLAVLIRSYTFELPQGPETVIEFVRGVLPRPKVAGEEGANVPMRVQRVV